MPKKYMGPVYNSPEERDRAKIGILRGDIEKFMGQLQAEQHKYEEYETTQKEILKKNRSDPAIAGLSEGMFKCRMRMESLIEKIRRAEGEIASMEERIASGYASDDDYGKPPRYFESSGKSKGFKWVPSEPAPLRYNERKAMEKYQRNKTRRAQLEEIRAIEKANAARYRAANSFEVLEGIFHGRRAAENAAAAAGAARREEDMRRRADLAAQKRAEEELLIAQGRNAHRRADAAYNLTEGVLHNYMSPPYRRPPFGPRNYPPFSRRGGGGSRSKKTRKNRK